MEVLSHGTDDINEWGSYWGLVTYFWSTPDIWEIHSNMSRQFSKNKLMHIPSHN